MMSGLRTIPDISLLPYTDYMAVLNLFYAYYIEKNSVSVKHIIPSQI